MYSLKGVDGTFKGLVFGIRILQVEHPVLGDFDGQLDVLLDGHWQHWVAAVVDMLSD